MSGNIEIESTNYRVCNAMKLATRVSQVPPSITLAIVAKAKTLKEKGIEILSWDRKIVCVRGQNKIE